MYCKKCGTELLPGSTFCNNCGKKAPQEKPAKEGTSKTAVILAVLLAIMTAVAVIFGILLLVGRTGTQSARVSREMDEVVESAISALTEEWEEIYDGMDDTDGYLEIKNTRVIEIERNADHELFEGVEFVVEFTLLSDYFGSDPYYSNAGAYDCVVIDKDGSCKVSSNNVFRIYSANTYQFDYSDIIEEISDLGDRYNQVFELD